MPAALQRVAAAEALLQTATAELKELQAAVKAASNHSKLLKSQSSRGGAPGGFSFNFG
jgi:hypothetical protein